MYKERMMRMQKLPLGHNKRLLSPWEFILNESLNVNICLKSHVGFTNKKCNNNYAYTC